MIEHNVKWGIDCKCKYERKNVYALTLEITQIQMRPEYYNYDQEYQGNYDKN